MIMLTMPIPKKFRCALSDAPMTNPVIAADGKFYERNVIKIYTSSYSHLPTDARGHASSLVLKEPSDAYLQELKDFYKTSKLCSYEEFKTAIEQDDVKALQKLNFTLHYLECGGDEHGNGALHLAARKNAIKSIRFILAHKIDVNQLNHDNETPLHVAAKHAKAEAVSLLLNAGADKLLPDDCHRLPLFSALATYYSCNKEKIAAVVKLLWPQADDAHYQQQLVTLKVTYGDTMLHALAQQNDAGLLEQFLKWAPWGYQLNPQNSRQETPLHRAVNFNSYHIVKLLLKRLDTIKEVDLKDDTEETPLDRALRQGHIESATQLLKFYQVRNHLKLSPSCMHQAASNGYLELMKILAFYGVALDSKDDSGNIPLHKALNHLDIVRWLMGKVVNVDAENNWHQTPLIQAHYAQSEKLMELYTLLIQGGANPYTTLSNGENQFAQIHDENRKKVLSEIYERVHAPSSKALLSEQQNQYQDLLTSYQQLKQEHKALLKQVQTSKSEQPKTRFWSLSKP